MILSCKILGPVSLIDFLKKVKKRAINIAVREYFREGKTQEKRKFFYHYFVSLESVDQSMRFQENVVMVEGVEDGLALKKAEAKKEILEKAVEIAEKLINLDFEITLNGKKIRIDEICEFKNRLKNKPEEATVMFFRPD